MTRYVYVGSETRVENGHRPEGIYVFCMDESTGGLEPVQAVESGENPSFMALHPNRRFLYCVNELREGRVTSFSIDGETGKLQMLNTASDKGNGPCYISMDDSGHWAFVANYGDGTLSVMKILANGQVETGLDNVKHGGHGEDPKRQAGPHAHSIIPGPEGKYAVSADLGTNKINVYRMEKVYGVLAVHESAMAEPGAGPRHMVFNPNGKFLYVSNELNNTVKVYDWNGYKGFPAQLQSYPTLPQDFQGDNLVADIHLTPDGRYLYVSNRGHDSLAVYRIEGEGDTLSFIDWVPTNGKWPRNFSISPDGKYLLVANQESNSLVLFKIHPDSGLPQPTGQVTEVPKPMFAMFVDL